MRFRPAVPPSRALIRATSKLFEHRCAKTLLCKITIDWKDTNATAQPLRRWHRTAAAAAVCCYLHTSGLRMSWLWHRAASVSTQPLRFSRPSSVGAAGAAFHCLGCLAESRFKANAAPVQRPDGLERHQHAARIPVKRLRCLTFKGSVCTWRDEWHASTAHSIIHQGSHVSSAVGWHQPGRTVCELNPGDPGRNGGAGAGNNASVGQPMSCAELAQKKAQQATPARHSQVGAVCQKQGWLCTSCPSLERAPAPHTCMSQALKGRWSPCRHQLTRVRCQRRSGRGGAPGHQRSPAFVPAEWTAIAQHCCLQRRLDSGFRKWGCRTYMGT